MDGDPAVEPELDTFSLILPLPYRIAVIFVLGVWAWGVNLHYLSLIKIVRHIVFLDTVLLTGMTGRFSAHQIFQPVCYDTSGPSACLQARRDRDSSSHWFTSPLLAYHSWLGLSGCRMGHLASIHTPHSGPPIHSSSAAPLHRWQISFSLNPEACQHWWHRRSWRRQVRRYSTGGRLDLLFQGLGRLVRGWLHVLFARRFLDRSSGSKLRWRIHGAIDHCHTKHDSIASVLD